MPSLLDAFTRQQVFLESYKLSQFQDFMRAVPVIKATVAGALAAVNQSNMGQLTRVQLQQLVQKLRNLLARHLAAWSAKFSKEMEGLTKIELLLSRALMENETDETLDDQEKKRKFLPLFGWNTLRDPGAMWKQIDGEPMPANGATTQSAISSITTDLVAAIAARVVQGYAHAESVSETVQSIIGTDALFGRDGLLNRAAAGVRAAINTIIQHVASLAQNAMSSAFATHYQWISVLDAKTTQICRSRDQQVFAYANGPMPPAHMNCRSRTVPFTVSPPEHVPHTFADWLRGQPADVRQQIGTIPSTGPFLASRPMTLTQLAGMLGLITRDHQ